MYEYEPEVAPDRLGKFRHVVSEFAAGRAFVPHANAVSSLDVVLADPAVDAVVIATPVEYHYPRAREALLAGKATYVEQPFAFPCEEAE